MDEELKAQFLKRFSKELEELLKIENQKTPPTQEIRDMKTANWMFTKVSKFVEDVFTVGKQIGELNGRLKGYDQGIKDQISKQKKNELNIAKLN